MPDMSEQSNTQSAETKDSKATVDTGFKSPEVFRSLSLSEQEAELSNKDYSNYTEPVTDDQAEVDSEASDDASETDETNKDDQSSEQASEKNSNDNSSESDSSNSDNQKGNAESNKKKAFDYEKAYKELQSEFTKRSQKLKELESKIDERVKTEKSPDTEAAKKDEQSRLAQLRKKDPEAAGALEELIAQEVEKRVNDRVKPVEEQVTLRRKIEVKNRIDKEIAEFGTSDLAPLQTKLLDIYNENPDFWQRLIWDNEGSIDALKKELVYRHLDEVSEIRSKAKKAESSSKEKKDRLNTSQVATKTKVTQATRDVMSDEEFRQLPLDQMEKRLPKVRQ